MASFPDLSMLRHTLATVAYRAAKITRDTPAGFDTYRITGDSRSALEILSHMGDLFDWALTMAEGREKWHNTDPGSWSDEVARFFGSLERFDGYLSQATTLACSAERLFQGPIADSLTHVGQLAMMRRLHGVPIPGENYFKAEMTIGRVSQDQCPPKKLFA
jgi:hypothetical protein